MCVYIAYNNRLYESSGVISGGHVRVGQGRVGRKCHKRAAGVCKPRVVTLAAQLSHRPPSLSTVLDDDNTTTTDDPPASPSQLAVYALSPHRPSPLVTPRY